MAVRTRTQLASTFASGESPTGSDFADLVDSVGHIDESGVPDSGAYRTSSVTLVHKSQVYRFSGAVTYTQQLPGATGSGKLVIFAEGNGSAAGTLTVSVAGGETLNGTTDGTFAVQGAHGIWMAIDVQSGVWIIKAL